jgi:hypothetical protein
MPTIPELLDDPDFKAASPGMRLAAFEHVASQDPDWTGATDELKARIRASVVSPSELRGPVSATAAARLPGTVEGPLPETSGPPFAELGPAHAAIAQIPAAMQRGGEALKSLLVNAPGRLAEFLKAPGPAIAEALSGRPSPVADVGGEALDVAGGAFAPLRPLNPAFAPSLAAQGPIELAAHAFGAGPETAAKIGSVGQQMVEGLGGIRTARGIQTGKIPLGSGQLSNLVRQAVGAPEAPTVADELAGRGAAAPAGPASIAESQAKAVGAGDELPPAAPAAAAPTSAAEAPLVRITWDTGPEAVKAAAEGGESIVRVPIDELLGAARESAGTPGRFRQQVGSTDKLTRARRFIVDAQETGNPVETPQISIDDAGALNIDDGLHRTVVARDLGYRTVPVRIPAAQLSELEQTGVRSQPVQPGEAYNAADAGRAAAPEGLAPAGREVAGPETGPAGAGNEGQRGVRAEGLLGTVREGPPAAPGAPQAPEELTRFPPARAAAPQPSIPPEGFSTPQTQGPLPKYAGSVNLTRINSSEDVQRAITEAAAQVPRSASVSSEELAANAHRLGMTLEDAEAFAKQTSAQKAKYLATRDVHTALEERYVAARDAWRADQTPENYDALRIAQGNQLRGFAAAQEVARQAGAALRSFQIGSEGNIGTQARRAIDQLLVQVQAKGKLSDEITRRLAALDLEDAPQVNTFLRVLSTAKATFKDKFLEAWTAGLLTGPKTHVVNTLSNFVSGGAMVVERGIAPAIDLARAGITGTQRERFFGEVPRTVVGMVGGLQDGAKVFLKTMLTELPEAAATKIEIGKGPAIGGTVGRVVRLPFAFLQAADDFFKTFLSRGALYGDAYREAAQQGLKGKPLLEEVDRLISNPTPELLAGAKKEAVYRAFQQELGPVGKKVLELREADPSGLVRFFFPFIKTPINVAKYGLERTGPLNLVSIATRAARGQGFAGGALSDELAKVAVGTGFAGVVAAYALDGKISGGGPVDANQRRALLATGWQPYSVKIGDKWFSFGRLEPFGTALGTVADVVELSDAAKSEELKQLSAKAALGFAKNITSKTFLQGMSNLIDALQDPARSGESFIGQTLGSFVPGGVAQATRAADETLRSTKTILDTIRARIPGQREELFPRRDVRGEPIAAQGNFWTRFLSPVDVSEPRGGPIERLIVQLGAEPGGIRDTISISNPRNVLQSKTFKLTPEQLDHLEVVSGKFVDRGLKELEARYPRLEAMPPEAQLRLVKEVIDQGRALGRIQFLREMGPGNLEEKKRSVGPKP